MRKRVVEQVHTTEVINVNRKVIKNKHFYPVNEREVNETVVEDYDCGSDINNPRCRRVSGNNNNNNGCGGNNNNSCGCHKHHCNCRNRYFKGKLRCNELNNRSSFSNSSIMS